MKKPNDSTSEPTKQLKIFLKTSEHAVVVTAAKLKSLRVKDYLKLAVITTAKEDAKQLTQVINDLS
jgi:hypothetical protein